MRRIFSKATLAVLLISTSACSLLTIKSPEKPLSTRDLNARILTHELAMHFNGSVEQAADDIRGTSSDGTVRTNALRWKIAASVASDKAASQMAPLLGLLDEWALTVQMRDYLTAGQGGTLFGERQARAATAASDLAVEAEGLAREVLAPQEFDRDREFVQHYATQNPIEDLTFARASIVALWRRQQGADARLVDSLGTVPEAMSQASDLLRMYGDTMPSQALWRAELAVQESGIGSDDIQTAIKRLDDRMAHLTALADSTPQLVHEVVRDVRQQVEVSWSDMIRTIHTERTDLSAAIDAERQSAVEAVSAERAALAADASRIAAQVIRDTGDQVRRLVRDALLLVILLALVILGLPFTAGYLVGRARGKLRAG